MTTIPQPVPVTSGTSRLPSAGRVPTFPAIETRGILDTLASATIRLIDSMLEWSERDRQRRHLMTLDDRMLEDIGVSCADAVEESRKRPWQA